jgi:hypothetical protein
MHQAPVAIRAFVVSGRASAAVVIDEIGAVAGKASVYWAILNIRAVARVSIRLCAEAAVASAFEVVEVLTSGLGLVNTLTMYRALVLRRGAVVVVLACCRVQELSRRLTNDMIFEQFASENPIFGEAWLAFEL